VEEYRLNDGWLLPRKPFKELKREKRQWQWWFLKGGKV